MKLMKSKLKEECNEQMKQTAGYLKRQMRLTNS
jgi:hypothetical protein